PGPVHRIRFSVKDTGVGMSPDQVERIFQPFEQVGSSAQRSGGTGLGLAISQKIVAMMGSTIQVQSQPGMGSVFWFDLEMPEAHEWGAIAKTTERGLITGYQGTPRTILVADDKWENRSVVASLLSPLGFQVLEAADGKEALALLAAHRVDLVITDLDMPEVDGYELVSRIRAAQDLQAIAVVVSSASVFDSDQQQSLEAGANDFLPKPVEAEELLDKLKALLKLEWVYDRSDCAVLSTHSGFSPQVGRQGAASLLPGTYPGPTNETVELLFDLAMRGNLKEIIHQADILQQDEQLQPFAQHLKTLAAGFQEKNLLTFIQQYRVS
ncbi:MAG TPA: response regulator, partial [Trichocoleus sp.]